MVNEVVFVAVLLVVAIVLRERLRFLEKLRIPASLIAGAVGLVTIQATATIADADAWPSLSRLVPGLREWPATLIAVVFAGMLLAKSGPRRTFTVHNLRRAGRQGLMVWIIVLGQTAVGLWTTWLVIQPQYELPNSTGMLIETGFAGGHGTAAAMGDVLRHPSIGLDAGLDLGLLMATAGLAYGLVSGIVWVNIAVRRGWVHEPTLTTPTSLETPHEPPGVSLGRARISGETIDPLLLQLIWVVLAFAVGCAIQWSIGEFATQLDQWLTSESNYEAETEIGTAELGKRLTSSGVIGSFPLFIYTLFGGAMVRWGLTLAGQKDRIDSDTIGRIISTAMDTLVVAAVATLNLQTAATMWFPLAALFFAGSIWCTFCLLVLSRQILPRSIWFPLGIINYGMSTGTTATGFVLLRTIDPELRSGAAEDYALAAPLSAPFIGGGIITVALPLLVLERVPIWSSAMGTSLIVVALVIFGIRSRTNSVDE